MTHIKRPIIKRIIALRAAINKGILELFTRPDVGLVIILASRVDILKHSIRRSSDLDSFTRLKLRSQYVLYFKMIELFLSTGTT